MVEGQLPERHEKIPPGQTLLFSEPLFDVPVVDRKKQGEIYDSDEVMELGRFIVPYGNEAWLSGLDHELLTDSQGYAIEYLSIAKALKDMGVPYRVIIAHREMLNMEFVYGLLSGFGIRGFGMSEMTPDTTYPRDIMVDFDGEVFINPRANVDILNVETTESPLGEGGRILKSDRKILMADPRLLNEGSREATQHAEALRDRFTVGYLPFPLALDINFNTGREVMFTQSHIDRVAALVNGSDGKDRLLLESTYAESSSPRQGDYWPQILRTCQELGIEPVVVEQETFSIPGRMNMVQFADGEVLMTGGEEELAGIVGEIVGTEKVHTTDVPIIRYPLLRRGGIRCITLFAPERILGPLAA